MSEQARLADIRQGHRDLHYRGRDSDKADGISVSYRTSPVGTERAGAGHRSAVLQWPGSASSVVYPFWYRAIFAALGVFVLAFVIGIIFGG